MCTVLLCDLHSFPTRRSSDLRPFRRVILSKRSDLSVSRLMFTESRPAARRAEHWRANVIPLVVMPIFSSPSRSEEHTSELQSRFDLVCRLLLDKTTH